jgi:MscS family membrane protein
METLRSALGWLQALDETNPVLHVAVRLLLSLLVAALVDWSVMRMARRIASRTRTALDDHLLKHLHKPILATLVLAGAWLATSGVPLVEGWRAPVFRIAATVLAIQWALAALSLSRTTLGLLGRSEGRIISPDTRPLFENLATLLVLGASSYFVLVLWDLDVTGWIASAGIAGIVLGFAAQDTLSNLFAGVSIFADRPYRIGDMIHLDSGERGRVTHIGLRSTRLLTRDHIEISIPNSVVANAKILNETGGPSRRFRIRAKVGVAYGSDLPHVRQTLLDAATRCESLLREPAPVVRLRDLGESSLDFEVMVWIEDPDLRGLVLDELLSSIYTRLGEENIEIPFPQRDVHLTLQNPKALGLPDHPE